MTWVNVTLTWLTTVPLWKRQTRQNKKKKKNVSKFGRHYVFWVTRDFETGCRRSFSSTPYRRLGAKGSYLTLVRVADRSFSSEATIWTRDLSVLRLSPSWPGWFCQSGCKYAVKQIIQNDESCDKRRASALLSRYGYNMYKAVYISNHEWGFLL